jgi:hypothetical protein
MFFRNIIFSLSDYMVSQPRPQFEPLVIIKLKKPQSQMMEVVNNVLTFMG